MHYSANTDADTLYTFENVSSLLLHFRM